MDNLDGGTALPAAEVADAHSLSGAPGSDVTMPALALGLRNLGNTCYLNASVQALAHSPPLLMFLVDCPGHTALTPRDSLTQRLAREHLALPPAPNCIYTYMLITLSPSSCHRALDTGDRSDSLPLPSCSCFPKFTRCTGCVDTDPMHRQPTAWRECHATHCEHPSVPSHTCARSLLYASHAHQSAHFPQTDDVVPVFPPRDMQGLSAVWHPGRANDALPSSAPSSAASGS